MNVVVFTTYDITPEHWADFTKAAAIPPQQPDQRSLSPYVLVHSRSQSDYMNRTEELAATTRTDFANVSHAEMYEFLKALPKDHFKVLYSSFFMVLDGRSVEDRKVTLIDKDVEWVDAEGKDFREILMEPDEGLRKRIVWKRHRIPFEKAFQFWILLDMKPGEEGEEFLEEVTRESV